MLEMEVIQETGFHNVYQNGKAVGFQVRYRSTYYRGVWLSLSKGFEVTVDGEKFSKDQIKVTIGGKTYTQQEMTKIGNVQWPNYEAAIVTVAKPGGLTLGVHEVSIAWGHRTSYTPGRGAAPLPYQTAVGGGAAPAAQAAPSRKLVLVY